MTNQEVINDKIRTLEGETIPPATAKMEEAYKSYAKARATFYEQGKKKAFYTTYMLRIPKYDLYLELLDKGDAWYKKHKVIKGLKENMEKKEEEANKAIMAKAKLENERDMLQHESAKLDGENTLITSVSSYKTQFKVELNENSGLLFSGGRKNRRRKSRRKSRRRKSRRKKKRTRKRRRRRRRK